MEDLPALINYFIEKKSKELQIPGPQNLAPGAINHLTAYDWPGNVRELENVVERALILNRGKLLTFDDIIHRADYHEEKTLTDRKENFLPLDIVNARHISQALKITRGKIHGPSGAASLLGLNPSTLRHRMRKLGIVHGRIKH
jgi:DNA-binding NtrC family response regulator